MRLKKLKLNNFRNYLKKEHSFPENKPVTILIGPNGKGKTNILEAIYILSLGRSFRTLIRDDLIEWSMDYMRVQADILQDDEDISLEVSYSSHPAKKKNFKKNQVKLKNSEYIGSLLTVLFHPEDLNMLYLSPSFRRKYMDILLSQTDRDYLYALGKYKKVLKQRNTLLHEIRDQKFKNQDISQLKKDLDVWDSQLIEFGSAIMKKRSELFKFLKKNLTKIYCSISDNKEEILIEYKTTNDFKIKLKEKQEKDILQAKTTTGPHLDDLEFQINNKKISSSASRGEYRTLLLAIKLIEIDYIREKTGENPVLLLDDVFSELDRKRQTHLLKSLKNCQTIITATDLENFADSSEIEEICNLVRL